MFPSHMETIQRAVEGEDMRHDFMEQIQEEVQMSDLEQSEIAGLTLNQPDPSGSPTQCLTEEEKYSSSSLTLALWLQF